MYAQPFDDAWAEPAPCCGEELHWIWDEEEHRFEAECSCMHTHYLKPTEAEVTCETEDSDGY